MPPFAFQYLSVEFLGVRFVDYYLCDTVAVPQVDEAHAAHLPDSLDPSGQSNLLSGILKAKLAACVCVLYMIFRIFFSNLQS